MSPYDFGDEKPAALAFELRSEIARLRNEHDAKIAALTAGRVQRIQDIIQQERNSFNYDGPAKSVDQTWSMKAARRIAALPADPASGEGACIRNEQYWRGYFSGVNDEIGENDARNAQTTSLRAALQSIADANPTDLALDPQWPSRIAAAALRGEKL